MLDVKAGKLLSLLYSDKRSRRKENRTRNMDPSHAFIHRSRPIAGRSSTLDSNPSYPRTQAHRTFTTQEQPQMFTPALFNGSDVNNHNQASGLDYETFLNLQQHLGVDSLRSNLNIAAAQTRSEHPSHPYHEPVYVYDAGAYGSQAQWQDQSYIPPPQHQQPAYNPIQHYPSPYTNSQHSASVSPPLHGNMNMMGNPEYEPSPLPIHSVLHSNQHQTSRSTERPALSHIITGPSSRPDLAPAQSTGARHPSRKRKRTQARQSRKRKGDDSEEGSNSDDQLEEEDDGIGRGPDGLPVRKYVLSSTPSWLAVIYLHLAAEISFAGVSSGTHLNAMPLLFTRHEFNTDYYLDMQNRCLQALQEAQGEAHSGLSFSGPS